MHPALNIGSINYLLDILLRRVSYSTNFTLVIFSLLCKIILQLVIPFVNVLGEKTTLLPKNLHFCNCYSPFAVRIIVIPKGGVYSMSRKGENIYKRKDGRWEGRYVKSKSPSGKTQYGYVYAKTYRDAKEKLRKAFASHSQQSIPPTTNITCFSVIASEWLNNTIPQVKESTINKYHNLLQSYILPIYGEIPLSHITHDFIECQCNNLLLYGGKNKSGLSSKTVMDTLSVIRNILKFAVRKGIFVPCDGTSVQIKQVSTSMRILSSTEQERLCSYLNSEKNPYNIGILLCLFTGLRVGEICALHWEDISFSEQTLYVHQTLQRIQDKSCSEKKTRIVLTTPKSACSIRTIPIPDPILKILNDHQTSRKGFLLTNSETHFIEPRTMQNRFKTVLKKSEIESANFHALRHTFATRCIELGFDVKSLSEILGHATVNITMNRYVHPTLEMKKNNMEKLSALFTVN